MEASLKLMQAARQQAFDSLETFKSKLSPSEALYKIKINLKLQQKQTSAKTEDFTEPQSAPNALTETTSLSKNQGCIAGNPKQPCQPLSTLSSGFAKTSECNISFVFNAKPWE